ncbi:MAG: Ig-like domain-containing protein [Syntrophomonadaceae bacterium]
MLIEDILPWGIDKETPILNNLGISYDLISSSSLATTALVNYSIIIYVSDQPDSYYQNINDNIDAIEAFVSDGGTLIAHCADNGWAGGSWFARNILPSGVQHERNVGDIVCVNQPANPVMYSLSPIDLNNWNQSYLGYFTNLPEGYACVLSDTEGRPIYVEYSFGSGKVLASMQTLDWHLASDVEQTNELNYATGKVVSIPVTGVSLDKHEDAINIGNSDQLTATIEPSNATIKGVNWSSDNEMAAVVDQAGMVKAVGPGTANITVTTIDGGFSDTCKVIIEGIPVTGVSLYPTYITLRAGQGYQLSAAVAPEDATDQNMTWSSDNEMAAVVDQGGNVTALSPGTATITVTTEDGGYTASCLVTVTPAESQEVFLKGKYIELGVSSSGSFGTESSAPADFYAPDGQLGLTYNDNGWDSGIPPTTGDFFLPGTSEEGFTTGYTVGYTLDSTHYAYTNSERTGNIDIPSVTTNTSASDVQSANSVGYSYDKKIKVEQNVSFADGDKYFTNTVTLTNNGTDELHNVRYLRSCDPDQDADTFGDFSTLNTVLSNPSESGNLALVRAKGSHSNQPLYLEARDSRARAANYGFDNRDPYDPYLYQEDGSLLLSPEISSDSAISLVFALGDLAPGQSVTLTYYTCMTDERYAVHVTGVSLDKTTDSITVGSSDQLTATVTPDNATNKSVSWESSDPSVATVSDTGLVTAIAVGTATITVTTADGSYAAVCAVGVKEAAPLPSVTLSDLVLFNTTDPVYVNMGIIATFSNLSGSTILDKGFISIKNPGSDPGTSLTLDMPGITIISASDTDILGRVIRAIKTEYGNIFYVRGFVTYKAPDTGAATTVYSDNVIMAVKPAMPN